ncbi:hypothetical protein [Taibaiella koreensis]|uniref:hypothetical protein n=1 Tax=Taibaiella koreensis TaxID=1268548 RepID=UPI0013C33951|nr:hypothetical protein [Taibaiella koreensis]
MLRKILLHGFGAGILAAIAALVYQQIYFKSLGADFSTVISAAGIVATSVGATLLASFAYGFLFQKSLKDKAPVVFNLLLLLLSFVSIAGPFAVKLPLELEAPELFPGLTVPMHFFPALAWLALSPLFDPVKVISKAE